MKSIKAQSERDRVNLQLILGCARSVHPRAAARGGEGEGMMDDDPDPTSRGGAGYSRANRSRWPHESFFLISVILY